MLPEVNSLLMLLSQSDNDCKFFNNDEDYDLGEVLKCVSGGTIRKHEILSEDEV